MKLALTASFLGPFVIGLAVGAWLFWYCERKKK